MTKIIREIHYLVDQQASARMGIGINCDSYQCIEILENGNVLKLSVEQAQHLIASLQVAIKEPNLPVVHKNIEYPGKVLS